MNHLRVDLFCNRSLTELHKLSKNWWMRCFWFCQQPQIWRVSWQLLTETDTFEDSDASETVVQFGEESLEVIGLENNK